MNTQRHFVVISHPIFPLRKVLCTSTASHGAPFSVRSFHAHTCGLHSRKGICNLWGGCESFKQLTRSRSQPGLFNICALCACKPLINWHKSKSLNRRKISWLMTVVKIQIFSILFSAAFSRKADGFGRAFFFLRTRCLWTLSREIYEGVNARDH